MHLIVTQAFDAYVRGDAITDPDTVEAVRASEHAECVVAIAAPPVEAAPVNPGPVEATPAKE